MMGAADKPPPNGAARKPPHTTHAPTLTHSLGEALAPQLRKVNGGAPLVTLAAANPAPPPPQPKQREPHKKRNFLEAPERRQAMIDYHRLGKTAACAEWDVSAQAIERWIEIAKTVAAGKPVDPRHRGHILGVTTPGSTRETAQAILRECSGGAEPVPPEPDVQTAVSPEAVEEVIAKKSLRDTNERIAIAQPAPDHYEREQRFMELRARIAGLEAELNRLTLELRRADKLNAKLRDAINTLTERE